MRILPPRGRAATPLARPPAIVCTSRPNLQKKICSELQNVIDFGSVNFWRTKSEGADKVLEGRISALEAEIQLLKAQRAEILDVTERLDRITKRAFRLREQMDKLEGKDQKPLQELPRPLTRADLLKMA